jgi:hypothetical protein
MTASDGFLVATDFLTSLRPSYILAACWGLGRAGWMEGGSDPQGLADGNPEGEVPLRPSCALVPQVQDVHESTQAHSSSWPQVR